MKIWHCDDCRPVPDLLQAEGETRFLAAERVRIREGEGGVGVFAVQLARRHGAHVLTSASGHGRDFLVRLGPEPIVDYHTERFEEVVGTVDVVFDPVGGWTLQRSWSLLGPGGRLVTIVSTVQSADDERTKQALFFIEPNRQQLRDVAVMVDTGQLRRVISAVASFAQAAAV